MKEDDSTTKLFSGRNITEDDMGLVRWACDTYPNISRSELAGTVCELIDWVTPAGDAKIPQCLAFFAQMESEGILKLPTLKTRKSVFREKKSATLPIPDVFQSELTECGDIELVIARPGANLKKWRGYLDAFHSLGDKKVFGSRLHYFIRSGDQDLGCLQFSASSWSLEVRDKWIGWSTDDRIARLFLVVNNSRFLILPNIRIKNLASRALSMAAKQIPLDWMQEFGYAPVLLETFVDTAHYLGISYKASNWILLGHTKGRGRMDRHHDHRLSPKAIFVYPLRSDFADVLKGVKAFNMSPLR
jgi:hypothetical protein